MNENWSLHLTLLNNRTGQKIGANYPKNKYEILEMLDRCQIPYGSGDYAHLAVPFPDGTPDSLQLKLAGVIENEHCPPSIRQVNFLAEQLQRMSAESREALMQELTDMPMAVITDVIRIAGRLLSELPLPQTIDLSERAVLLTEQEPYFRLNVAALESESTEDGVWLDLPMQNGALEQLMLHLDVQDTDELEIRGLSGVVSPDDLELGEYEIFLADIHDYDAFARTLMECVPIHAMAKYKALLLARPTSIQGATKLATTNLLDPCCGCGKALRQLAEGNNCFAYMAMTALPLALIVPAEGLPADDRTAQGAVWSTVASLLQSGLGRKFSKFYPQLRLEQQGGYAPFGVVLGRAAPPLFRELYRKALDRQAGAIMHHTLNTLSRLNPDQFFEEDGTIVCPAVIDGSDPDLMFHGLWHLAMQQGEILPDCGVYHVAQKRASIEPKEVQQTLAHPERYALCMVCLEPPEVPCDDEI